MKTQVRVSATTVRSSAKRIIPNQNNLNITSWLKKLTVWLRKLLKDSQDENKKLLTRVLAEWDSRDQNRTLFKLNRNTPGAVATYQVNFAYLTDKIQIGIDELGELRRSSLKRQLELGENYKKQEVDIGLFDYRQHPATHRLWLQHAWRSSSTNKVYQRMRWILDFDAQQSERYEKAEAIAQYIALYFLNLYCPANRNPVIFSLQEDLAQILHKACRKELGDQYNHIIVKHLPRDEKKVKPLTRLAS